MIAIDWGTSSLRAYRLGEHGEVRDKRSAPLGILTVQDGRFAEALEGQISDWLDAGEAPVVMSGMIGSRQGWKEAPYAQCPAGLSEIAAAMIRVHWNERTAWIAPGLTCRDESGVADVMRGEEVQILGAFDRLAQDDAWICLPGTHSKWAQVRAQRIVRFATYMTGEVFAVMKAHSILGRMMSDGELDLYAFDAGLGRARDDGGLLHHLFGARTRGLFGELDNTQSAGYLSGLLIGHELRSVPQQSGVVYVLGAEALAQLYVHALRTQGYEPHLLDPDAVVTGLARLAALARV
jgi:2-dehydro-3-deoxygalactonokinase